MVEGSGTIEGSITGNIKSVYSFEQRIANGGFGVVYLASHKKTGKRVFVLKL